MTSINDNDQTGGRAVARGLREIADWLDEHPSLTPQFAFVSINACERVDLERVALALGDRATEKVDYGRVKIEGRFAGGARVYAEVPVAKLAGEPVQPAYEPILNTTRAAA